MSKSPKERAEQVEKMAKELFAARSELKNAREEELRQHELARSLQQKVEKMYNPDELLQEEIDQYILEMEIPSHAEAQREVWK